jgi:hypothetical protein
MLASRRVYQKHRLCHISMHLDSHSPEGRSRLAALRGGFKDHIVVEYLDEHHVRVDVYSGLAMELLR